MVPLQFCYQFYACLIVVALFGGVSILAVALMTLYGIGGVELIVSLCFVCFYGLARLLMPPWYNTRSSFLSSNSDVEDDDFYNHPKKLAVTTYILEEKEEVIWSCSCCPICLLNFKTGDSLSMGRVCGHVFHHECLGLWLPKSSTCPYCRQDLVQRRTTSSSAGEVQKPGAWGIFDGIFDSVYT
jgi:hypothetical protein